MENISENKKTARKSRVSKESCIGILAHVDAGKTTLSEAILFLSGKIRRQGRVDNRDAYLDTYELERARGITIFSKQAVFSLGDRNVTLVDTPGHVDFSAEMERTLRILDYAILVINGSDGVQGHTETLWRLLNRYQIPVFLFVNKMDLVGCDKERLLLDLKRRLDGTVVDFTGIGTETDGKHRPVSEKRTGTPGEDGMRGFEEEYLAVPVGENDRLEEIATCSEEILDEYLEHGTVKVSKVRQAIQERKLFPCYFGSALKLTGVEEFLQGFLAFSLSPSYPEQYGARVFKISRDELGNRLTHLKITGGCLKVKDGVDGADGEKVNQIRIYSGAKFESVPEAGAGTICAVTGPVSTRPGQGLGFEAEAESPLLEPVLTYEILLPAGTDAHVMLKNLRILEEEEPQLHIAWNESLGEIQAQVMGDVQMEILKSQVMERFGVEIGFGSGNIVYKETILKTVEGVGHYEPLRHYAEVHLLMEPLETGSGLVFDAYCSEDMLDRNWQRLILTHLEEKRHRGVLTRSEITDMKITLIAGRAHIKHTEGGDFRQATYRAVRQGLKEAGCRLLEPFYGFRLEIPQENLGRAMADIERMQGKFDAPVTQGDTAVLTGTAPVSEMRDYQREMVSYTRGRGRLSLRLSGYGPCHNEEEVVARIGYDFDSDLQDPAGSVFCSHGAGFLVPWNEAKQHMHVESDFARRQAIEARSRRDGQENSRTSVNGRTGESTGMPGISGEAGGSGSALTNQNSGAERSRTAAGGGQASMASSYAMDKELEEIFNRTFGPPKRSLSGQGSRRVIRAGGDGNRKRGRGSGMEEETAGTDREGAGEYLLVDGYNIIFAWEELRELAETNIDGARHRLMDILSNYQGVRNGTLILVFDAYKVVGNTGEAHRYHNIHVIYTKEAETADQYIEKLAHQMGKKSRVTVATSDGLEQLIIRGQGCMLLSAEDLKEDVERVGRMVEEERAKLSGKGKNYLLSHADQETRSYLEQVRLGEAETGNCLEGAKTKRRLEGRKNNKNSRNKKPETGFSRPGCL